MTINTKLFCNFVMSNRDWLTYWLSDFESSPLNGRFAISGTTFSLLKSVKILKIFYDASSYCSAILPFHLRREFFSFQKMFNVTYDASSFRLTTLHLRREFFFFFFEKIFSRHLRRVFFSFEKMLIVNIRSELFVVVPRHLRRDFLFEKIFIVFYDSSGLYWTKILFLVNTLYIMCVP
jgi:hypothetical protein